MRKLLIVLLAMVPALVVAQSLCQHPLMPKCPTCSTVGSNVRVSEVKTEALNRIAAEHKCKIIEAGNPKPDCELERTIPFGREDIDITFITADKCYRKKYHVIAFVFSVTSDGWVTFSNVQVLPTESEGLPCGNRMGQ